MMIPVLTTARLLLTSFRARDAERVEYLAGEEAVARTTSNIPHPYPNGAATQWIATHEPAFQAGAGVVFAVRMLDDSVIGCVSLDIDPKHERGELGYWMGRAYWGNGYMTEAARACVEFGLRELGLQKITARYLAFNPASGRVMEKIGMKREGLLRRHLKKDGILYDVLEYGILREELD